MPLFSDRAWKTKYTPEDGDVVALFYVPALDSAVHYERRTGYFSASALALAARGIEGLIRNNGRMRLVFGCTLDQPEVEAIERGEALAAVVEATMLRAPFAGLDAGTGAALELLARMGARHPGGEGGGAMRPPPSPGGGRRRLP